MSTEQAKEIIDALVEFVLRVSKGETTSEKAVEVLPEVVSSLKDFDRQYGLYIRQSVLNADSKVL